MRVMYDRDIDILTITLKAGATVESDEISPGVIVDLDSDGNVVGLEILDASRRVDHPGEIVHAVRDVRAEGMNTS
jgi:uncharacterized protein YuzE